MKIMEQELKIFRIPESISLACHCFDFIVYAFNLAVGDFVFEGSIERSYVFIGYGIVPEVFGGRIRPQNAAQVHRVQRDGLFRLKTKGSGCTWTSSNSEKILFTSLLIRIFFF
jgi:hypothetical protein